MTPSYKVSVRLPDRYILFVGRDNSLNGPLRFFQDDSIELRASFSQGTSPYASPPPEKLDPTGWTMTAKVGSVGNILVSQSSFTAVADSDGVTRLVGTLNLSTAQMEAAVAAAGDLLKTHLEFEVTTPDGSFTARTLYPIEILPEIIRTGSAEASPLVQSVFTPLAYGAKGDKSADDTAAINAAIAAASAYATAKGLNGQKPQVYFPPCLGYKITSAIAVPRNVSILMDAPIMAASSMGNVAALTIGEVGPGKDNFGLRHRLQVYREATGNWSDEGQIGIKILNAVECSIDVVRAEGFTIGLQLKGEGSDGFVHNHVFLGRLSDNKVGLDLAAASSGWCNENVFYAGRFTATGGVGSGLERIGVRIGTAGTVSNGNKFIGPSFELQAATASPAEAIPVLIVEGTDNIITSPRHEGNSSTFIRTQNNSRRNLVDGLYDAVGTMTVDSAGAYVGAIVRGGGLRFLNALPGRVVFNSGPVHKLACYYDGSASIHIPGLHWQSGGTTPQNLSNSSGSGATINADYLEIDGSRAIGVYLDTRLVKRFTVRRDVEESFGGRVAIRAYNASGTVLTDAPGGGHPYVKAGTATLAFTTAWGGVYATQADDASAHLIEVGPDVAFCAVLVRKGTDVTRVRSFSIESLSSGAMSTWAGYEEAERGANIGTAAPTAGTWERGRRIYHATPSASGTEGWVCTSGGTPGTWKAFGSIAA